MSCKSSRGIELLFLAIAPAIYWVGGRGGGRPVGRGGDGGAGQRHSHDEPSALTTLKAKDAKDAGNTRNDEYTES